MPEGVNAFECFGANPLLRALLPSCVNRILINKSSSFLTSCLEISLKLRSWYWGRHTWEDLLTISVLGGLECP